MIQNTVERDRVLAAVRSARAELLWRVPVRNRYVDDYMAGNLASIGVYADQSPGRKKPQGSPGVFITVNVDTAECWYYSATGMGGPALQHEEQNKSARDLVVLLAAHPVPKSGG